MTETTDEFICIHPAGVKRKSHIFIRESDMVFCSGCGLLYQHYLSQHLAKLFDIKNEIDHEIRDIQEKIIDINNNGPRTVRL